MNKNKKPINIKWTNCKKKEIQIYLLKNTFARWYAPKLTEPSNSMPGTSIRGQEKRYNWSDGTLRWAVRGCDRVVLVGGERWKYVLRKMCLNKQMCAMIAVYWTASCPIIFLYWLRHFIVIQRFLIQWPLTVRFLIPRYKLILKICWQ